MSDGTVEQIAGNNRANEVWCGKRPPFKEPPPLEPAKPARVAATAG